MTLLDSFKTELQKLEQSKAVVAGKAVLDNFDGLLALIDGKAKDFALVPTEVPVLDTIFTDVAKVAPFAEMFAPEAIKSVIDELQTFVDGLEGTVKAVDAGIEVMIGADDAQALTDLLAATKSVPNAKKIQALVPALQALSDKIAKGTPAPAAKG